MIDLLMLETFAALAPVLAASHVPSTIELACCQEPRVLVRATQDPQPRVRVRSNQQEGDGVSIVIEINGKRIHLGGAKPGESGKGNGGSRAFTWSTDGNLEELKGDLGEFPRKRVQGARRQASSPWLHVEKRERPRRVPG